jgi:hypothetical protein
MVPTREDREDDLPGWWRRPELLPEHPRKQLALFFRPVDETLFRARICLEEAEQWRQRGWLSFDISAVAGLGETEVDELLFVRDVARSGFSMDQVSCLLEELGRPYRYDRTVLAYSFPYGWVEAQPHVEATRHALMREQLDHWLQQLVAEGERELLEEIQEKAQHALASLGEAERTPHP